MTRISSNSPLIKYLKKADSFVIIGHYNPEGDAIGSCIALASGLKRIGKSDICVLNRDGVPEILRFLPGASMIEQTPPEREFDLGVILDCNTIKRTGFDNIRARDYIIVDHHLPSSDQKDIRSIKVSLIDPDAAATGVLIYKILKALKVKIDRDIATNLYTAILIDTGGFRYQNTNPESLRIASHLVEAGADPWEITKYVYESIPFKSMKLLGLSLSTLESRNGIAWIKTTTDMFKKTGTTAEDCEDFVDFPRKVKDIEVAVFFRQDGARSYKISLRSKGNVNVEKIARQFGGGGHAPAAGCNINGSFDEVKEKVLKAVEVAIKETRKN